jgi:predicted transcriptional regulator
VSSLPGESEFAQYLYKKLDDNRLKDFSADLDISINTGETKSVKGKIFVKRDEYIFVNINFLGIELGRAEITPDSIKFINRIEKTFYFGNIETLNAIYKIDLSYSQIEALISKGLIFDKSENKKRFKNRITENGDSFYVTYSNATGIFVKSIYDKNSFRESGIEITNGNSSFYLFAALFNYYGNSEYPENIKVNLNTEIEKAEIEIAIGKILENKLKTRSFNVNSRYREIKI